MPRGRKGPPQDSIDSILLAISRRDTIDPATLSHYFVRLDEEWMHGAREKVLHLLKSQDPSAQTAAMHILSELATDFDLEELEEFVADPTVSDVAKLTLSPVLKELGSEMADEGIIEYLNDPPAAMQQMQLRLLELVGDNETGVEAILDDVTSMSVERRLGFVQWLGASNDARATSLLIPLLESQTGKVATAVIEALEQLGPIASTQALPALNHLLTTSSNRQLKQVARATLGRLTMQAAPGMEDIVMAEARQQLPPFEARVSFVDGSGTQLMMLAWKRPDALLKVVNVLYQDSWGIKDCYGLDEMDTEHWNDLVASMNEKSFGCFVVPFAYGRSLIAEARAVNKRTRRKLPIAYFIWRPLIESEALDEQPAHIATMPPPQTLDTETLALAQHGDELYALNEFVSWMYEPLHAIEPYMNRFWEAQQASESRPKRGAKAGRKAKPKTQRIHLEPLLDEALSTVIDDSWRLLYETRLRRQAQLFQLTNREQEARLARATAAMLHPTSHIPAQEQPFLRFMMRISIEQGPLRMMAEMAESLNINIEGSGTLPLDFFDGRDI
ncbi:MAG: hypothetical protein NVS4B11_33650 [Ktedonobacteraceae bacterium]